MKIYESDCRGMARAGAMETVSGKLISASQVARLPMPKVTSWFVSGSAHVSWSDGRYDVFAGLWNRGREVMNMNPIHDYHDQHHKCYIDISSLCLLQVLQKESPPQRYLTVDSMESVWGIRSSVDSAPYIYSASAGTVGPSNPSEAFSKRENQTSWLYNSPTTYGKGIEVSCSNCSNTVLYAENIDSLRSSHQNLKQPGTGMDHTVLVIAKLSKSDFITLSF